MQKISVIIPCYNVENYIDRCLESVCTQTVGAVHMEIICINDGSTDSTLDRLYIWEKRYPDNLMLINLTENAGQSTARNAGILHSTGEYLAFIDSDDWIEKDYLEKMLDVAESKDCDIVQCSYIRDSSEILSYNDKSIKSQKFQLFSIDSEDKRKELLMNKLISSNAPFKLVKRSLLSDNDIKLYDGLCYEDISFGILLSLYTKKFAIIEDKLYHYYTNPGSTVLKKNSLHHLDLITTWSLFLKELKDRGFWDAFQKELELEVVYSCVLIFWKIMILRYDEAPYSFYRLLCAFVQSNIPDIMTNDYINKSSFSEVHKLILNSCFQELSRSEFKHFAESIRKIGL